MGNFFKISYAFRLNLINSLPLDHGLANQKNNGVKGSKVYLTYVFAANADGSEKRLPLIIGKAHKPQYFKNKTGEMLGFLYQNNTKAWMTFELYQEWLIKWNYELQLRNRHILLLQDNFAGHICPKGLTNIKVENFGPNLTAHVQPMDARIIHCFKAHYCCYTRIKNPFKWQHKRTYNAIFT